MYNEYKHNDMKWNIIGKQCDDQFKEKLNNNCIYI